MFYLLGPNTGTSMTLGQEDQEATVSGGPQLFNRAWLSPGYFKTQSAGEELALIWTQATLCHTNLGPWTDLRMSFYSKAEFGHSPPWITSLGEKASSVFPVKAQQSLTWCREYSKLNQLDPKLNKKATFRGSVFHFSCAMLNMSSIIFREKKLSIEKT